MANYFKDFPKIDYNFADGTTQTLADINIKYDLSQTVLNTKSIFYKYTWRDFDRPDSIADKYYDSSDYYWLVLQSNQIYDINYELPFNEQEFNQYLMDSYSKVSGLNNIQEVLEYTTATIHHYEDSDGDIIDETTYNNFGGKPVSIYEYEFIQNENKRNIELIDYTKAIKIKNELQQKLRLLQT